MQKKNAAALVPSKVCVGRDLLCRGQIAGWRGSELFSKHGDEGAGCAVAGIERGIGDRLSRGQGLQCVDEARLLTPTAEGHSAFLREEPLHGPLACAAFHRQGLKRGMFARVCA